METSLSLQMDRNELDQNNFCEYYKTLLNDKTSLKEHFLRDKSLKCRVCLQAGRFPVMDSANGPVRDMLAAVTSIEADKNDELPKRVCAVCYKFLKVAIQFRAVAKQTKEELTRYMVSKQEPPDVPEQFMYPCVKLETSENNDDTLDIKNVIVSALPIVNQCKSGGRKTSYNYCDSKESPNKECEYCNKNIHHFCQQLIIKDISDKHSSEVKKEKGAGKRMKAVKRENTIKPMRKCVTKYRKVKKDFSKIFDIPEFFEGKYPEKVTCKICNLSMKYISMRQHYYHKHDPNAQVHMCEHCGKSFTHKPQFDAHITIHVNDFPFKCTICPYKGKTSGLLRSHMRTHSTFNYICDHCPRKFKHKCNLRTHLLRHQEPKQKCEQCERVFYTKSKLKNHFEVAHLGTEILKHICSLCGNPYSSRKKLRAHERKVHKRAKFFQSRMPSYLLAQSEAMG